MADLVFSESGDFLAVVCNTEVKVLDMRDGSCKYSYTVTSGKRNQQAGQEDNAMLGHCLLCCFSRTGSFFALCTPQKELLLWRTSDWTLLNKRELVRRTTVVSFSYKEDYVIAANKGGDVYRFSVYDANQEKELLLGHVSMILDMVLTRDSRFLITADRDEKIRVSSYPNCYNIQSFCLGHLDFVSCLSLLSRDETILVSGGGDGAVRFWDPEEGKQIICKFIGKSSSSNEERNQKEDCIVSCLTCCDKNSVVCALIEGSKIVHLYYVTQKEITSLPTLETDAPPWQAIFDPAGRLWCVQPHVEEPITVFQAKGEIPNVEYKKISDCFPVLNSASDWDFLKGCVNQERKLTMLRKKEVDNMTDYLARKEDRIERKKKKKDAANGASDTGCLEHISESEAKRPRLEV